MRGQTAFRLDDDDAPALTPADRVAAYARRFPQWPGSHFVVTPSGFCQAHWILGNNYRGSGYYGAYPPGLLARIWALYPDVTRELLPTLHLCSGSLTGENHGVRLDVRVTDVVRPDVQASAIALPFAAGTFALVLADLPYGDRYAENYGTGMPSRRAVLAEAGLALRPAGQLAWLDTMLPMYRKTAWRNWGQVCVVRSTNHVVRLLSLFEIREQWRTA